MIAVNLNATTVDELLQNKGTSMRFNKVDQAATYLKGVPDSVNKLEKIMISTSGLMLHLESMEHMRERNPTILTSDDNLVDLYMKFLLHSIEDMIEIMKPMEPFSKQCNNIIYCSFEHMTIRYLELAIKYDMLEDDSIDNTNKLIDELKEQYKD